MAQLPPPATSVEEQLQQLNEARKLVLGDANYYPAIIQGILPIINANAHIKLRRWGSDFLAETFANPMVSPKQKETMSLIVLETLKLMIENPNEDAAVVKSVVQAAASIYPYVFKWIINNSYDKPTWERMTAIKSRILRIWDTAPTGIRICCIKFAQKVVFVQTAAPEDRRDPQDISVAMVPENHEIIPPQKLGAEASGLLDRILGVFHESSTDAVLIDATLNTLSLLIRARPTLANKILNAILNFNPLKLASGPMTPKMKVMAKSMEKTVRVLMIHILKREPQNPLNPKIDAYVQRLMRSRAELIDESTAKKRGPPEPTDGLDPAKRQKLGAVAPPVAPAPKLVIPPLAPGPHTAAELFTITDDKSLQQFDVGMIPEDLVLKIVVTIMKKVDGDLLKKACAGVLDRCNALKAPPPPQIPQAGPAPIPLNPNTAPLSVEVDEDEDEYEPDFEAAEDTEQILNKLDNAPPEPSPDRAPEEQALTAFRMPAPEPLTEKDALESGEHTINRVIDDLKVMTKSEPASLVKKQHAGLNRLAGSAGDKDAWVTILTRLATRSCAGLENLEPDVKLENKTPKLRLSDTIRERLYMYIFGQDTETDWRLNMDVAVAWLNEEWYNEKVLAKSGLPLPPKPQGPGDFGGNYDKWAMKVLEGMMPYLEEKDKALTRFLGEIPKVDRALLGRVKRLCRDPVMIPLTVTALLYLVMMKPPSREAALDTVEEVWVEYEDARPMAGKYLAKWRPGFIEKQTALLEDKQE